MTKSIQQIAKDIFVLGFDAYPFEKIVEVLTVADNSYFNEDESFLEDSEYDALKRYAHTTNPTHPYFLGVGSTVRGGKVKLPVPMGSLDQIYEGEFAKWVEKHKIGNETLVITDKLDGYSALVVYDAQGKLQIAYSRGDGYEAADITRHVSKIHNVPQTLKDKKSLVVRGELIISPKNFQILKDKGMARSGKPYKNPRNMVSGLMNSSTNKDIVYKYIDFVAYEIVQPKLSSKQDQLLHLFGLKFAVVHSMVHVAKKLTDSKLTTLLNSIRKISEYELDGIVIDVDKNDVRQRINPSRDTINPAYAVKYKVADASNLAIATVKEVEWNISKDGFLKPRVCIDPVELVGVTVQHASGFNAKFIRDRKIGPGAKIKITRSGDVIPFILEVVSPMPTLKPSKQAPHVIGDYDKWLESELNDVGDWEWTPTGVDAILVDINNNVTVQFEQLNDFFASIDAPHLREGSLQTIFDAGFTTPEDVIMMTEHEICGLIGKANGKKIFAGIRGSLTNIPLYTLMGSHSCFERGVGRRKFKKLWEAFEGDMTLCKSIPDVLAVDGFEHKTATKVAGGYDKFQAFYNKIKRYVTIAQYEVKKQGSMTGQVCVMTGFRDSQLEQQVVDMGGLWGSGVSKNTTILVAKDPNENSGKLQKARDLGVKIMSLEQFKAML